MAKTDNPEVQSFTVLGLEGQNQAQVLLGPEEGMIITSVWPKDEHGNVTGIGTRQTIVIHRHTLIGLAYEILRAVDKS